MDELRFLEVAHEEVLVPHEVRGGAEETLGVAAQRERVVAVPVLPDHVLPARRQALADVFQGQPFLFQLLPAFPIGDRPRCSRRHGGLLFQEDARHPVDVHVDQPLFVLLEDLRVEHRPEQQVHIHQALRGVQAEARTHVLVQGETLGRPVQTPRHDGHAPGEALPAHPIPRPRVETRGRGGDPCGYFRVRLLRQAFGVPVVERLSPVAELPLHRARAPGEAHDVPESLSGVHVPPPHECRAARSVRHRAALVSVRNSYFMPQMSVTIGRYLSALVVSMMGVSM